MSGHDIFPFPSRSAARARSGPADLGRLHQTIGKFTRLGQLDVGFGDSLLGILYVSKGVA